MHQFADAGPSAVELGKPRALGRRSKQREESGVSVRERSHGGGEASPLHDVPSATIRCKYTAIYLFYLLESYHSTYYWQTYLKCNYTNVS